MKRRPCGQRWLERIWTVLATCSDQNKSLLDVLRTSLKHFFGPSDFIVGFAAVSQVCGIFKAWRWRPKAFVMLMCPW
ncbi:hypothetical protein Poly21_10840 [Allorhodopirellula heiligendammensis]|uniref:Uncharacterized protein n=1 Tax=Allorhodopirellula heiligendammensis TaxID=2714739 RepID=A0A5C6C345_9BACT|nr:hypothetical protein Poly21_10840 [Allorhodopirellula heiligendammensis]